MTMVIVDGKLNTPKTLERFLKRQSGTWFAIETFGGIEGITQDRTEAFAFLDGIVSFFPWISRWKDGEKDGTKPDVPLMIGG